ncbi:UNVERIFIED_CONTAM: hypothetical protein FKN15_025410 [Acipenser sinensis]
MDTLYRVHDAEKLGLAHFPPVEASIAALVQVPNLTLLSKDATCPNKQCRVSEVILKCAYLASMSATRLGNYNSILVAYQCHLLRSLSENHRPSPQQLDELRLVNKNLLRVSKLNRQDVSENHRPSPQQLDELRLVNKNLLRVSKLNRQDVGRLWLSQVCVSDRDKAPLLDAPITPGHTFGPTMDMMLQKSITQLVHLLPKRPSPVRKPVANWSPRPQQPQRSLPVVMFGTNPRLLVVEALIGL